MTEGKSSQASRIGGVDPCHDDAKGFQFNIVNIRSQQGWVTSGEDGFLFL